jgi:tetratricopeptide (TPR) repeat protein
MSDLEESKPYHGESKRKRLLRAQRAAQRAAEAADEDVRPSSKKKLQQMVVGWVLTIIFGISSVGFLATLRTAPSAGPSSKQAQDPKAYDNERLKEIEKRLHESPSDPGLHYEAAGLHLKLGDVAKATSELQATLQADASHAEALHLLPRLLLHEGQVEQAQAVLEKGIEAETAELKRRNAERPKDEPEITPDARLRALLLQCYVMSGPAAAAQAKDTAAAGLELNPMDFTTEVKQSAFQLALSGKKPQALKMLALTLKAAQRGQQDDIAMRVIKDLKETSKMVATFKLAAGGPASAKPSTAKPSAAPDQGREPAASPSPSADASSDSSSSPTPAAEERAAASPAASSPAAASSASPAGTTPSPSPSASTEPAAEDGANSHD